MSTIYRVVARRGDLILLGDPVPGPDHPADCPSCAGDRFLVDERCNTVEPCPECNPGVELDP